MKPAMRQIFVLPADRRSPSGGNLYNRLLIAALRAAGTELRVMTIEAALRDARSARPARYWIDSLLMDRVADFRRRVRAPSECFLIVHYFPSLRPALRTRSRNAYRAVEDAAFRAADGFLFTSDFAAAEVASRGVRQKPCAIVPPALAVAPAGKARAHPPLFSALMAGPVTPDKGVLEFLRALARHLSPADDFRLEIAGRLDADPAYAARCVRLADGLAALRDKVRFAGALDRRAMKAAYERHRFFVSASGMETFGMALQEARAFGLYILALDRGNAGNQVRSPAEGAIFATIDGLAERTAALVRDREAREALIAATKLSAPLPTWAQAAARFLAQVPMPQRRSAENIRPPRSARGATARPTMSARSRAAAHAPGMSPRGMKVQ